MKLRKETKLKNMILEKGFTLRKFCSSVAELCNKPEQTIYSHVQEISSPDDNEITAFALLLEVTENDIRDMLNISEGKSKSTDSVSTTSSNEDKSDNKATKSRYLRLNRKAYKRVANGRSVKDLSEITGIPANYIYKWNQGRKASVENAKKFSKNLGVKTRDLFYNVPSNSNKRTTEGPTLVHLDSTLTGFQADTNTTIPGSTDSMLVSMSGVGSEDEMLKILNANLSIIYNTINTRDISKVLEYNEVLSSKIDILIQKVTYIESYISSLQYNIPNNKIHKGKRKVSSVNDKKDIVYDETDTLEEYSNKIDRLLHIISVRDNVPVCEIKNNFYRQMNSVYGVVWSQLQKEYFLKYGRKQTWSLALLYENKVFRQIFFNIIKTESTKRK